MIFFIQIWAWFIWKSSAVFSNMSSLTEAILKFIDQQANAVSKGMFVNLLRESHKERNCVCFHLLFVLFYFGLVPIELEQHTKPQSHVINPYPQVAFNIFLVKGCCFQSPTVFREWSQVQPPHFIHTYILLSQGHQ